MKSKGTILPNRAGLDNEVETAGTWKENQHVNAEIIIYRRKAKCSGTISWTLTRWTEINSEKSVGSYNEWMLMNRKVQNKW